ncbi:Trehalase [Daphnia magna]|uniref:Trehalase n=1 Tax=Daphnia magna TaxID=35525 RepID=A0A0N8A5Y1_9CRUS|nr:Trehalase [Daphnia magna]
MVRLVHFFLFISSTTFALTLVKPLPPPCPSPIYCHGPLLHTVQMAKIYHDSKTFVDKKLRFDPDLVAANFSQLMNLTHNKPSQNDLIIFISQHFESEGSEFQPWDPSDWLDDPSFLKKISNQQLRNWGKELHGAWKFLGRQIKDDVRDHPELYSMIYVPNPFIIPGGRFREIYYWDSYWIVQGLLLSQMNHTVRGMLENFMQMVDVYGLVPNGGRIYYQQRSQPPMLIPMVDRYINATGDVDFLNGRLHLLEKEFKFWLTNRTVTVRGHTLARFNSETDGPRPESYMEDFHSSANMSESARQEFYVNMKSGAESGWDFSSRWFIADGGHNEGNLSHISTRDIIPVDLNAFICMNARILSEMFRKVGDERKARLYHDKYVEWKTAIQQVLWNEDQGIWLDYDISNNVQRSYFYASNIAPLWAGCWDPTPTAVDAVVHKVIDYLETSQSTKFAGGIPTSMLHTGQQWDFPNGWPPLQHMLVVGLENTGDPRAKALAFKLAQKWLINNYDAYQQSMPNAMFEKYDVTVVGLPGGGGEYDVQLGFGWTNGVIMDFLNIYGDRLVTEQNTLYMK